MTSDESALVPDQTERAIPHAQELGPAFSDNSAWHQRYSDSARFGAGDRFDEDVFNVIEQRLMTTRLAIQVRIAVSVLAVIAFAISLVLLIFDPHNTMIASLTTGHLQGAVRNLLAQWLNPRGGQTGSVYLLSALVAIIVAVLAQVSLSAKLWSESREYLRSIKELKRWTHDATQIYPGGGTLQFAYGTKGVCVFGNSIDLKIGWHAVADPRGLMFLWLTRATSGKGRRQKTTWAVPADVNDATHLLLFLKSNDASEFLVIPKRFFDEGKNATPWSKFVGDLMTFKQAFDDKSGKVQDGS